MWGMFPCNSRYSGSRLPLPQVVKRETERDNLEHHSCPIVQSPDERHAGAYMHHHNMPNRDTNKLQIQRGEHWIVAQILGSIKVR